MLNRQTGLIFFWNERLKFQFDLLLEKRISILTDEEMKRLEKSIRSLFHGDLWRGNVLFSQSGAVLIDPAVYYGAAESDIAMTRLFGGFPDAFYDAAHPKKSEAEKRTFVYQLYTCFKSFKSFWPFL